MRENTQDKYTGTNQGQVKRIRNQQRWEKKTGRQQRHIKENSYQNKTGSNATEKENHDRVSK